MNVKCPIAYYSYKSWERSLNSVQVSPDYFKLYKEKHVQFKLQGFDGFYNLMSLDPANIQYSLSHNFGTVTSNGVFSLLEIKLILAGYMLVIMD